MEIHMLFQSSILAFSVEHGKTFHLTSVMQVHALLPADMKEKIILMLL